MSIPTITTVLNDKSYVNSMNMKKLQLQIDKVNGVIKDIPSDSLGAIDALVYATAKTIWL